MTNVTAVDTTQEVEEALDPQSLQEIKQKSVSGVASFFIRTAFLQAIGLGAQLFLSAFLSAAEFGIYGFVIQIIGLLTFFSDIGLAASLIQKKDAPSISDYRTAFTIQQILSWLIFGITLLIAASGLVQNTVGEPGVWVLLSLGISFPILTFKTVSGVMLERELDFGKLVLPQIIEQLVFNGVLIYLAWQGFGVLSYAYAIILRSIVGTVAMLFIKPWSIRLTIDRSSLKNLMNFGLKFQANDLIARFKDNLFFIFIARFMSTTEYGYISWAKQWSMYPYTLTVQNVMAITFPTFSRLQGHNHALQRAIEKSLFFISLSIFPLLIGMCVFIFPLTQIVNRYQKWEPAIFSFVLFTLSIAWAAVSSPLVNTLNAIGKINTTLKLMIFWTALTWIITPVLVRMYGFNGVAIASLIISFTSFIPIILVKKLIALNVLEQIWRQTLAAGVMAIVGILGMKFWSQGFSYFFIGMLLTALSYGGTMIALGKNKLVFELSSLRKT